LAKLIKSKTKN